MEERRASKRYQFQFPAQYETNGGDQGSGALAEPRSYKLRLPLEYRTHTGEVGTGMVAEISSRGARLELDRRHPPLTWLRLHVVWPVKLDGLIPLQLRISSRVVRSDGRYTGVEFRSYEFVTARRSESKRLALAGSHESVGQSGRGRTVVRAKHHGPPATE